MSVQGMLQRRNLKVLSSNPTDHLVFPTEFPASHRDRLFELLGNYGFRTLLKDLILHKDRFTLKDLTRYCSPTTAQEYLNDLLALELVKKSSADIFHLENAKQVLSLGDTLEWHVATLLKKRLECDSQWHVVLKGLKSGGDFDVLAECENYLLYIEVKSGPPKSIELENLEAFIHRINDLGPDLAILFEDTTLRMKDKIVPHLEEVLHDRFNITEPAGPLFQRLRDETFRYRDLFITNSKPGIMENIRFCIASFLKGRGLHFGDPSMK